MVVAHLFVEMGRERPIMFKTPDLAFDLIA
jgi:hypothetical protein